MPDLLQLCADLAAEHDDLDRVVAPLEPEAWDVPTPAIPWSVRDQIAHLTFFDEQAVLAATDPEAFAVGLATLLQDYEGYMDAPLIAARAQPPAAVLDQWRDARTNLLETFDVMDPGARVPWYGPAMSAASFITARIMETWAHGQDVVDALGVERMPTDRLKHIAFLGVRARPFSYQAHRKAMPPEPVAVRLDAPGGDVWAWDEDASQSIAGSALDFCLLVTQRRHPADTDLRADGGAAEEWLSIAQCFAGPPGEGRAPGQFPQTRVT